MDKSLGLKHYENKFKKKGNKISRHYRHVRIGNSYSGAMSRPSHNLPSRIIEQRQVNIAIKKYGVIDYRPSSTPNGYVKNVLPKCAPY